MIRPTKHSRPVTAALAAAALATAAHAQSGSSTITLYAPGAPAGAWKGVQWQDRAGNWHDVQAWQSAIDMAEAYLASGENDPELTKLSNEIIAAQEKEIAFLKGWLEKNAN